MSRMARNRYGLDEVELARIRVRDKTCVYCGKTMLPTGSSGSRGDWATIEHLNHLPPWDNHRTVAICCWSCNASRGDRTHEEWFQSPYCRDRGITGQNVAEPVRDYLRGIQEPT